MTLFPPPTGKRYYTGEPPPVDTVPDPDPPPTGKPFFPAITHNEEMDTWVLRYDGEWAYVDLPQGPLPKKDTFTLIATATLLPTDPTAGVGLFVHSEKDGPVYLLASEGGDGKVPVHLMIVFVGKHKDGVCLCYKSDDGVDWKLVSGGPLSRPTTGGLVLRYGAAGTPVTAMASRFRVLEGLLDPEHQEVAL